MPNQPGPVVLNLAAPPREQVGPFVLLGVDKAADKEQIEASWAQRVIWARRNQSAVPLEDVNWAREALNEDSKRVRADAASLNTDTSDRVLRSLADPAAGSPASPEWQARDVEKALAGYSPSTEIPGLEEVRQAIALPDVPQEFPAVRRLLEQFLQEPLDPWSLQLPATVTPEPQGPAA